MARDEPERESRARRFLLAAGGAGAAATLAGCSGGNSGTAKGANGGKDAASAGRPPEPSAKLLDDGGWTQFSHDTNRLMEKEFLGGQVTVTADGETTQYGNEKLRAALKERTLGGIDTTLALFAVTRIVLDPNPSDLPMGLGVKQIISEVRGRAERQFEGILADSGMTNVRKTGSRDMTVASGAETTLAEYRAGYPYDAMRVPMPGSKRVTIDGGSIEVTGLLAVWREGRYIVVAGGAYPASNVTKSTETDLSDAITVDVDVDLGLTPDAYGTQLRDLIASVE